LPLCTWLLSFLTNYEPWDGEVRTDTRVTAFSDYGVELNNGETLATQTLVWTSGVKPPEVLQSLPVQNGKGTHPCQRDARSARLSRRLGGWRLRVDSEW